MKLHRIFDFFRRVGPIGRITIGLVSLSLSILIGFDVVFGLFPRETDVARQIRQRVSQTLATQVAVALPDQDFSQIGRVLNYVVDKDPDLISAGLRRRDRSLVVVAGPHELAWANRASEQSNLEHVVIPMFLADQSWGHLELKYIPVGALTIEQWITTPSVKLLGMFLVAGSIGFYLYLRRVLQRLDPSAAVPDRVRMAFDTLSEGLIVLDGSGRVMMANRSILEAIAAKPSDLIGKFAHQLTWLKSAAVRSRFENSRFDPWSEAIRQGKSVLGIDYEISGQAGGKRQLRANFAPIFDGGGRPRGCMVTFNDVTEMEKARKNLSEALVNLAANREVLEAKNSELERLASRDSLTGCLNRRVFFDRFERVFNDARSRQASIAVIMGDIDKFKLINDTYGHGVGDDVIRSFAAILQSSVRGEDIVARYGGEEFCIVLIGASLETGMRMAERIRRTVELDCGAAVTAVGGLRVTSSFGVSAINLGAATTTDMVNEADQALYVAKQSGRNRVSSFAALAAPVV